MIYDTLWASVFPILFKNGGSFRPSPPPKQKEASFMKLNYFSMISQQKRGPLDVS
jgi:hypothetical protein